MPEFIEFSNDIINTSYIIRIEKDNYSYHIYLNDGKVISINRNCDCEILKNYIDNNKQ